MTIYIICSMICVVVCVAIIFVSDIAFKTTKHTREHNIGYWQGIFVATVIMVMFNFAEYLNT